MVRDGLFYKNYFVEETITNYFLHNILDSLAPIS